MESKSKNFALKAILFFIGIGIWVLVLQNAGIIPKDKEVYVIGGNIEAEVSGRVYADIYGSVTVDNTVDVNIHEINGYNEVTTGRGTHSVFPFGYMLPVDNW